MIDSEACSLGNETAAMLPHLALFETAAQNPGRVSYEPAIREYATSLANSYRDLSEREHLPLTLTRSEASSGKGLSLHLSDSGLLTIRGR